ncbi:hypothetical protein ACWEQL_07315 [Kitasatospora sp. NPDC004240]
MTSSTPEPLSAAEALRLAEQATAAAQVPGEMPGWYGPTFAAAFSLYGSGIGLFIDADRAWLSGVVGALFAALTGALAAVAVRQGGIVHRTAPGTGGPVTLAVLAVIGAGLAGMLIALAAGGGAAAMGAAAGIAAGATFWTATARLNTVLKRRSEAR